MIIKNILAGAFFALLAVWAAAPFATAQTVTRTVTTADLDLRHDAGQATLRHRIVEAVNQVCGAPDPRGVADMQDYKGCRRAALRQAMAQANLRIRTASAQGIEFASR